MRSDRIDRLVLIAVLWLALGLRLSQLDAVPHDYDRSYPHGLAIALLDSVADGSFGNFALHGQAQSLGLPNPVAAQYVLAVVALVDRAPYVAVVIVATANLVVVAIAGSIGRRAGGRLAGWLAAGIAATSPWAVYYARGTWQLGLFELSIALPAWILWRALLSKNHRLIIVGGILAAFAMQIYTVGFGLLVQLAAMVALHARSRSLLRPIVMSVCVAGILGALLYAPVVLSAISRPTQTPTVRLSYAGDKYGGPLVDGPVNVLAAVRAIGIVGGSEFESTLITAGPLQDHARDMGLQARALAIAAAVVAGLAVLVSRWRVDAAASLIAAWFLAPVVAIMALTTLSRSTPVNYYYVLLTSPSGYVCAGLGCAALARMVIRTTAGMARVVALGLLVALTGAGIAIPAASLSALAAQHLAAREFASSLDLPLRDQMAIAHVWTAQCAAVSVPFNPYEDRLDLQYWTISLKGSKSGVRPSTEATFDSAQMWATRMDGGTCSARSALDAVPPGPNSAVQPTGAPFRIYRSGPEPARVRTDEAVASIGWTMVSAANPEQPRAGQPILIDVTWSIDRVPDEQHAAWRYDTFVKLRDASGVAVAQADVVGPPGSAWQTGDLVHQRVALVVPGGAPTGTLRAEVSLYDRTLQRNATFAPGPRTNPDGVSVRIEARPTP